MSAKTKSTQKGTKEQRALRHLYRSQRALLAEISRLSEKVATVEQRCAVLCDRIEDASGEQLSS